MQKYLEDAMAMASALRNNPDTSTSTATTPSGYLTGTQAYYNPTFGGIPYAVNPIGSAASATAGNIANLGANKSLAADVNAFNLGQVTNQYTAGIPNYNAMTQQSSGNILAALQGQVPSDVTNLIQQGAAERGIATGGAGSSNANAAYLRALGLTSLGQQQYGEQALTGAVNRMPKTALYSPTSGFVTPEQQLQQQQLGEYLANAPVPAAQAGYADMMARLGLGTGYGGGGGGGNNATTYLQSLLNSMNQSQGSPTASTGGGQPPYTQGANTYPGQGWNNGISDEDWWYMSGGTSDTDYYPWEELA